MIDDKDKQSIPECGSNGLPKRHACGLQPITPAHCLRHASLNSTYFSIHRETSRSKGGLLRSHPFREHNPSYSRQTEGHYGISSRYSIKRPSPTSPKNRNHSFSRTLLIGARFSSILQCRINRKFGSDISRQRLSRLRQLLKLFLQTRRTS